ncbi:hypothetical protein PUN28_003024 [Cardiocondyla obscurior]|uniref:Uncharacterized protein n=1 Tax=Cardiocondyla obscurior TaxID=286306 RepID=A0AAW2GX91_9HYME
MYNTRASIVLSFKKMYTVGFLILRETYTLYYCIHIYIIKISSRYFSLLVENKRTHVRVTQKSKQSAIPFRQRRERSRSQRFRGNNISCRSTRSSNTLVSGRFVEHGGKFATLRSLLSIRVACSGGNKLSSLFDIRLHARRY